MPCIYPNVIKAMTQLRKKKSPNPESTAALCSTGLSKGEAPAIALLQTQGCCGDTCSPVAPHRCYRSHLREVLVFLSLFQSPCPAPSSGPVLSWPRPAVRCSAVWQRAGWTPSPGRRTGSLFPRTEVFASTTASAFCT